MLVLGHSLNLLSSVINIIILTVLLTCPNSDTLLCYSNDPFLTVWIVVQHLVIRIIQLCCLDVSVGRVFVTLEWPWVQTSVVQQFCFLPKLRRSQVWGQKPRVYKQLYMLGEWLAELNRR